VALALPVLEAVAEVVGVPVLLLVVVAEPVAVAVGELLRVAVAVVLALPVLETVAEVVAVPVPLFVATLEGLVVPVLLPEAVVEGQRLTVGEAEGDGEEDFVAGMEDATGEAVAGMGVALPHSEGVADGEGEPDSEPAPLPVRLLDPHALLVFVAPGDEGSDVPVGAAVALPHPEGEVDWDGEADGEGAVLPERLPVPEPHGEGVPLPERDAVPHGVADAEAHSVAVAEGLPPREGEVVAVAVAPAASEGVGDPPLTLPVKDPEGEPVEDAERHAVGEALPHGDAEPLRLPDCEADGERVGEAVTAGEGDTRAEGEPVADAEEVGVRLPATRTAPSVSSVGATAKVSGFVRSAGSACTAVPVGESRREVAVKAEESTA